jgi:hypothetical protein
MRNPRRDVPIAIIRSGIVTTVAYILILGTILLTLPKGQLSQASGFISAYQLVNGVLPGPLAVGLSWLIALAVVALSSSGSTWLISADRTLSRCWTVRLQYSWGALVANMARRSRSISHPESWPPSRSREPAYKVRAKKQEKIGRGSCLVRARASSKGNHSYGN